MTDHDRAVTIAESPPPAAGGPRQPSPEEWRHLRRRHARERIFKILTMMAVSVAGAFILFFVTDLVGKGWPALRQTEIKATVTYAPGMVNDGRQAFDERVRDLISTDAVIAAQRQAATAKIRLPVHYGEAMRKDPTAALREFTVTAAMMSPWRRNKHEPTTITPEQQLALVDSEDLATLTANLVADPDLAGTTRDEWIVASDRVQLFMIDSSGFKEGSALREAAVLLTQTQDKRLQRRYDADTHGEQGTSEERWVLAESDVDLYVKGYEFRDPRTYDNPAESRLSLEQAERIDALEAEGMIALNFNTFFFTNGDSGHPEGAGMKAAIVGSIYVLSLVLLMCLPIGVMTSIYLEEFAPDNKLTQLIEVNINNLAAIPSILFGVLGLAAFINFFGMPRSSVLVGAATLALMTLPVIIISSRAALRAVPASIRRAGFAMGATRWQVVLHHVLPSSVSGIMTGSIIGIAQAMGETAPLIIIGMTAFIPDAASLPTDPTTVMPAQIFTWYGESLPGFRERAALGILVLLVVLVVMNAVAVVIRARSERAW